MLNLHTKTNMKKRILFSFILISLIMSIFGGSKIDCKAFANESNAKLAIVIDDFGEDRSGVEEMLNIPLPLTIAVMPGGEFSEADAKLAHEKGHEVILHMPMQNDNYSTPESYYGPIYIKNHHTASEAAGIVDKCIQSTPYCNGVNIHMGTGISKNKELMTAIMTEVKKHNLCFLDSKTIEESVCPECAKETGVKFFVRDEFLEPPGRPNKQLAKNQLQKALELAKEKGCAIAIGHVGPVGRAETAAAISEMLEYIRSSGVEVVHLSKL